MKHRYTLNSFFIRIGMLILVSGFAFTEARASHAMGADLEYICLGPNASGQMQYRINFRFYRDCGGISAPGSVTIMADAVGCGGTATATLNPVPGSTGIEVSQLCPNQLSQSECSNNPNPTYPGVRYHLFSGVITLPTLCATWRLRYTLSARNNSDNLAVQGQNFSIEAFINNTINPATGQNYCNNSVVFSSLPVPFFCVNNPVSFNHSAVDADGDSLVYQLVNPLGNAYAPINFAAGFSVNQPVTTNPPGSFQFNGQTGQMNFTPGAVEVDALAIKVTEYRNINGNWVLVGSTMRDIQVTILNCAITTPAQQPISNIQNATPQGPLTVQACPGTPLQFDILCTDAANHNLTLASTIAATPSAIPGAVFSQVGFGDTVIARINWTPLPGDTGCHDFVLTTRNDDCPINGVFTQVYTICIYNQVQLLTASNTFCGNPVQLTASGGTNFTWSPPNGLNSTTILNPTAAPTVPTMYYFTSDCGTDSVFIDVDPPFQFDAGPGGQICQNGQIQLGASVDNLYGPYDIQWVPSTGLIDPVTGLPNDSILNPVASPLSTTEYKIYFTGTNGCTNLDSTTIVVSGTGPIVTARAQPTAICPGETVQLDILSSPLSCGISQSLCNGQTQNIQAGTANVSIPAGSPTQYPTVYGHYQKSGRMQILYTAAELLALTGGAGGKLHSISFNITQINTSNDTIKNFEIKMGCTQATSLSSWQNGLVQVFSPKSIPIGSVTGWKTHVLDNDYDWDGSSNLVVEICFNNPTGTSLNHKVQGTATAQPMVYYSVGGNTQCGITGTPSLFLNRPNTRFDICISTVAGLPISWTPSSGPNAVVPANTVSPVSTPQSPVIYYVDVTDTNGCVSSDFVYVQVDTNLRFSASPNDTFFCAPTAVQLQTSVQGSPLPGQSFSYNWQSIPAGPPVSGANPTVTPNTTTTYVVTLLGGACTLRDTIVVNVGNSIPVNFTVDSISCNGANDGQLIALPSGGASPITYNWSVGGPNTNTRNNLGPGIYSVAITDGIGCTGSGTYTLTQPAVLSASLTSTNTTCFGAANGTATASVNGGTLPYAYNWSPANLNQANISNLSPGVQNLTVTDANSCTVTQSTNITQPPQLALNVFTENATSFGGTDGSAYGIVSGGTVPYTFNWSTPPGGNNDTITGLAAGTYILTVCDANNNCCIIDTGIVNDPPPIVLAFTPVQNPCFGDSSGSVSVSATGGVSPYTFVWSTGAIGNSINNLIAGTYSVTATDSAGVTVVGNVPITQPTVVTIVLDTTPITCFGGANASVLATASGGTGAFNYLWSNGSSANPQSGLAPQTINVTATDVNGCTGTASWVITQPAQLLATNAGTTPVSCFGGNNGTALAQVTGGTGTYSYAWTGSASTSNPGTGFAAGPQVLTTTDQNGCTDTAQFTITEPTQLQASVTPVNASCETSNDGSATATVSGGTTNYTYSWDNVAGAATVGNLDNGAHTLLVTDNNSCTVSVSFNVDTNYMLHISATADSVSCFGGADGQATVIPLNGAGPYGYVWSPSGHTAATAVGLSAGLQTVIVTDNANCIATATATVFEPTEIILALTQVHPLCTGDANGSATVTASGGSPGYTYDWDATPAANDNNTISGLAAGLYNVTVTDAKTCQKTGSVTLTDPPTLQALFINKNEISCANTLDGSVEVQVQGGTTPYGYVWAHGPTVAAINNLAPGTYQVTVTDGNSCSATLSATFLAPPPVDVIVLDIADASCPKYTDAEIEVVGIGGTPGNPITYEYSIDGVTYQASSSFKGLEAGYYTVHVRDAENCSFDTLVMVDEPAELVLSILPQDSTIALGEGLQLDVNLNQYPVSDINSYVWSPSTGLNCADCKSPFAAPYAQTTYTVTVNYLNNCIASETVQVFVGNGPDIYIPNAFTPNGDGDNDVFTVYGAGLRNVNLKVFNRWGEKIFDSNNQWLGWDGHYRGQMLEPGVYTYIVEVTYLNDKKKQKNGTITLIR